jgi:cytochrome o ubiquinol oxidase subunit 3
MSDIPYPAVAAGGSMSAAPGHSAQARTPAREFHLAHEPHPENGTALGFWLYLMSDCLIFAALFATYGVLGRSYAAGPTGAQSVRPDAGGRQHRLPADVVHHLRLRHAVEAADEGARHAGWLLVTGLFGLCFLALELYEFAHLIHQGAGPQRSAFLSAFFTLVGTHGLHVTFGLIWLVVLMLQINKHGLIRENKRRLMCLSMFWHFLDVVWIGVFTFVYLMGVLQ